MAPQNKRCQKLQKKTIKHYKGQFLNTQKIHFMLFFVIKIPMWFVGLQVVFL